MMLFIKKLLLDVLFAATVVILFIVGALSLFSGLFAFLCVMAVVGLLGVAAYYQEKRCNQVQL